MRGTLRAEGQSIGIVPAVHVPSGVSLASDTGLFNHYRVFRRGHRYGYGARRWPSEARRESDGSVSVVWQAAADRPFALRASYRWEAANLLDVTTEVTAEATLPAFEVFLASYCDAAFTDSRVHARSAGGGDFTAALLSDGLWQAFPRDASAMAVIGDGRWDLEPHPLSWTVRQHYADAVAVRRDPVSGITVVAIAKRSACFGVFTPHGEEKHFSHYLSLFGTDLAPGDSVHTVCRLAVLDAPSDDDILAIASAFTD